MKGKRGDWPLESSLQELRQLALTAGAQVVGSFAQHVERPTPNYFIGKGKLEELVLLKTELDYNLVIFDEELSPAQQRNLEETLDTKVIDRTALILDIFAQRARTHEGRLQVELAQNQYLLSHLVGRWLHLERLGGGIGTRGPGESQLETDRRIINRKIQKLKRELEAIRKHRSLYRRRRREQRIPVVALVGYTNAGKSALFNALSRSQVLVEDKLFATLDPTTRRITLPGGRAALITDTVGFIQKLPPELVAAFRATLEELDEASLLLHVVDVSSGSATQQYKTAEQVLRNLNLTDKPRLAVFNKVDLLGGGVGAEQERDLKSYIEEQLYEKAEAAVFTSATTGEGLDRLLELIAEMVGKQVGVER